MVESRRLFAAVGLGFGLIVAGCGGTGLARPTDAPVSPPNLVVAPARVLVRDLVLQARLVRSVSLTSAQRTARTSISVTLTGLGKATLSSSSFDIAGSGVVDLQNGDADLTLSIPRYDRMSGGAAIEQRIVSGAVFAKLPADILRVSGLPASVRWLSLDPKQGGGTDPSGLSQSQADPAGQLAFLAATSADVRRIGAEPVRGVPAMHYAATIDLAPNVQASHAVATEAVRLKLAQLGVALRAHRLGLDVWLDGSGRARRIVVSLPLSSGSGSPPIAGLGPDAMMRIQGDFYGFGTPVRVAVPPQAEVRPYATLRLHA